MNSPPPTGPPSRPRGAFPARAVLLLVALVGTVALILSLRPPPAQRAYQEGARLLAGGRPAEAAAKLRRAIELNPRLDGAWHALLEADPSLRVCRRLAENHPELFDFTQPIDDRRLLVRDAGWVTDQWRRTLALYEKAVLAAAAKAPGGDAALLRLDLLGRREVAEAWREVRTLRDELRTALKTPLSPQDRRRFDAYDLEAVQRIIVGAIARFKDPAVWLDQFARIEAAIDKYRVGIARLQEAAETDPGFLPTQLTLAYMDLARGRTRPAEERCRRLLRGKGPGPLDEPRVRLCLARALELSGRPGDGAAEVRRAVELAPGSPEIMPRLAVLELHAGRIAEAESVARNILRSRATDASASYVLGVVSLERGDAERAVEQLSLALRSRADNLDAQFALARAQRATGRNVSAWREFSAVAAKTRHPAWPLAAAAACALSAGNGMDAAADVQRLLADTEALAAAPRLREHAERIRIAAAALEGGRMLQRLAAPDRRPQARDSGRRDYLLAGVLAARAYVSADAAITPDPESVEAFRSMKDRASAAYAAAFLLAGAGDRAAARTVLEGLAERHPKHVLGALFLARLTLLEGKTEQAARALRRTGLAASSRAVAGEIALIESFQGAGRPIALEDAPEPGAPEIIEGPHFAFFDLAVYDNHRAYAEQIVLLDPACDAARAILKATYPSIRKHGLRGVRLAAEADPAIDLVLQQVVAAYQAASRGRLADLAIGDFWNDLPAGL